MTVELEFSRTIQASAIPPTGRHMLFEATPEECAALARRFGLSDIKKLAAKVELRPLRGGGNFKAVGTLTAEIVQTCVVSLSDFPAKLKIPLDLRFVAEETESDDDLEAPDEILMDGETLEVGEAVAQALSLALDPYPRRPGAVLPAEASDPEENPFEALKALRTQKD